MTLYDILEVSPRASKEVIEKAYRVLVKKYHPDFQKAENKSWAEEKMKKLNNAYEVLSDEENRAKYNKQLNKTYELDEEPNQENTSDVNDIIVKTFLDWYRKGEK